MLDKFIAKIQSKIILLEAKELHELQQISLDEAVKVALKLTSQELPAMPEYELKEELVDNPELLADIIDDTLEKVSPDSLESGGSSEEEKENEYYSSIADKSNNFGKPDNEVKSECMEMQQKYAVNVGISWGTLPSSLQSKWIDYGCDYHLQHKQQLQQGNNGVEEEEEEEEIGGLNNNNNNNKGFVQDDINVKDDLNNNNVK